MNPRRSSWNLFVAGVPDFGRNRNMPRNFSKGPKHQIVPGDSVGSYGLEGPEIESRCRRNFLHPSRPALGSTQSPIQWVLGLFARGKAAGAWL